jgi:hypothetical protein
MVKKSHTIRYLTEQLRDARRYLQIGISTCNKKVGKTEEPISQVEWYICTENLLLDTRLPTLARCRTVYFQLFDSAV